MKRNFLSARWINLLMANYVVDKRILERFTPAHTELDSWNGNCYVSLVGFLFADTRVLGIPIPFHRTFEEVNLRFYVRHRDNHQWKRGVVFIKEIVPKPAITFVANTIYSEKYATHRMSHSFSEREKLSVEYRWKVGSDWNFLKATAEKEGHALTTGSEAEYITEHYWGYSHQDETRTTEYEVRHPSWKIHRVEQFEKNCSTSVLYGKEFEGPLQQTPASVFLAAGSEIEVMQKRNLTAA